MAEYHHHVFQQDNHHQVSWWSNIIMCFIHFKHPKHHCQASYSNVSIMNCHHQVKSFWSQLQSWHINHPHTHHDHDDDLHGHHHRVSLSIIQYNHFNDLTGGSGGWEIYVNHNFQTIYLSDSYQYEIKKRLFLAYSNAVSTLSEILI